MESLRNEIPSDSPERSSEEIPTRNYLTNNSIKDIRRDSGGVNRTNPCGIRRNEVSEKFQEISSSCNGVYHQASKNIEQFQNEQPDNVCIDYNNIILNKSMKYLLNFIITYLVLLFIMHNFKNITLVQFILLICTITSVLLYILDLIFPVCNIV